MPVQRYEIFCNSQLAKITKRPSLSCLCRCKDTKFFAIHNRCFLVQGNREVVYAGAKIRIFLQFTTLVCYSIVFISCLCRCKDTKFFAIHNRRHGVPPAVCVVYAGAKIRNFLQFTTAQIRRSYKLVLFMPVQRYEIFCNSQPRAWMRRRGSVVYAGAKIRNFLQFTTMAIYMELLTSCLCRCKDTKFFAIHNASAARSGSASVVYAGAKIRNFLQFTTADKRVAEIKSCLCRCKDTKFFAIHNC